jgi:hypothetical protein
MVAADSDGSAPSTKPGMSTPITKKGTPDTTLTDGTQVFQLKVQEAFSTLASNSCVIAENSSLVAKNSCLRAKTALMGKINDATKLIMELRKEYRNETDKDYRSFLLDSIDNQKNNILDLNEQIKVMNNNGNNTSK